MKLGDREVEAEIEDDGDGLRVNLGDGWRAVDLRRLGASPRFALTLDSRTFDVLAAASRDRVEVLVEGSTFSVETVRPRKGRGKAGEDENGHFVDGHWGLRAPLTGSVVDIRVAVGDTVEQGSVLMVIEAMKMQNELRSRVGGQVSAIKVEKGQRVEAGAVMLEVSAPADDPP